MPKARLKEHSRDSDEFKRLAVLIAEKFFQAGGVILARGTYYPVSWTLSSSTER
jgi:hypothetical protein